MNLKKTHKFILLSLLFGLLQVNTLAQTYPVNSNVALIPPYSLKIQDYYAPGSNPLQVNLYLCFFCFLTLPFFL